MADTRYPNALAEGTEIGGYLIRRVLGQGGFGITYEGASATGIAKLVAIKEFFPRGHASRHGTTVEVHSDIDRNAYEAVLKRFEAEGKKLIEVYDHPNIVRGENFVRARGSAFIIMEYVDGVTLQDWLKRRDQLPPESELKPLMLQILDAVDYIHEHGGIHRDLSPKNIMMRERRRGRDVVEPVLIDFGALGEGLDIVRDGSTVVTANPGYAPPEQLHPQMHPQGRYTDIFALGGVLYYAVAGRSPERPADRLAATWKGGPSADIYTPAAEAAADPSRHSEQFLAGIDAALQLDPRKRPQTVTELKRALGWAPRVAPVIEHESEPEVEAEEVTRIGGDSRDPDVTTIGSDRTQPDLDLVRKRLAEQRESGPPPTPEPDRRGGVPWGVIAAVLLVLVGAGALWRFGPDLFRPSQQAPVIGNYLLTASIAPDGVTLDGFVPTEADRQRLVAAARRPGGPAVTDRLRVAEGAPDGFVELATFALARLPELAQGTIEVRDRAVTINGTARSPEAYAAAKQALASPAPGGARVTEAIRPATVASYRWAVDISPQGIQLSGYVPDEAARQRLLDAARKAAGNRAVRDTMAVAEGAPAGFVEGAVAALGRIGDFNDGRIGFADGAFRAEGTVRTAEALVANKTFFGAALPGGLRAAEALRGPGAPPQPGTTTPGRWVAELGPRGLSLTGTVPDEEVRRIIAFAARSAVGTATPIDDKTTIAAGTSPAFAAATRLAVDLLARLRTGRIEVTDGQITVEGTPRSAEDEAAIRTALTTRLPQGFRGSADRLAKADTAPPRDTTPRRDTTPPPNRDITPPPVTLAGATECDRLALPLDYPEKPTGVIGVAYGAINADAAIRACEQAIREFPQEKRLQIAYGQALAKKARFADARAAYERAAALGDGRGFGYLGWMSREGLGTEKSLPKAADQYEKGAALNDRFSLVEFALVVHDGLGGRTRDQRQAYQLFQRAAALGHPLGHHYVGWYLQNGLGGVPADPAKALESYRKAAELGSPPAMNQLGVFYHRGLGGLTADLREAVRWYERAAEAGSDIGAYNAAIAFDQGQGTEANPDKAARYLLAAFRRKQTNAVLAIDAGLAGWENGTVRAVQRILRDAGLYRGFIDGGFDTATRNAIDAYGRTQE